MSALLDEPISPELVLVCPELRRRALDLLPAGPRVAVAVERSRPSPGERALALLHVVLQLAWTTAAAVAVSTVVVGALTLLAELD